MQKPLFSLAMLATAFATVVSACRNVDDKIAVTSQIYRCHINSDCAADLVCVFQRCHEPCSSSRDCERGARCVAGEGTRHVCQLEDEATCSGERACPGAQICGVDRECRDACSGDGACLSEQVCRSGTCADAEELDTQGELVPAAEPPDAPTPCAFDSDCPGSLVCRAGSCVTECTTEADCADGQLCRESRCTTPATETTGCVRHSDCGSEQICAGGACQPGPEPDPEPPCSYDSDCAKAGQHCLDGACQCECQTSADCSGAQQCSQGCQCVAGRVIDGNVVVNDNRQLAALADVVQITGKLTIQIPGIGEYHLPNLRHVGAFATNGDRAIIVADVLEDAPQGFSCSQDCRAPQLKTAGLVQFSTSVMDEIELPALTTCKDFKVFYSTQLRRISAPLLDTAGYLQFEGNSVLTSVDFPKLATLDAISVAMNESLVDLSLPLANPGVAVGLSHMAKLETLSLPAMTGPSSDIVLDDQIRLQKVDFSGLKTGRQLSLTKLPALRELQLTKLDKLSGSFALKESAGPSLLELPALTETKDFELTKTGVTALHAPFLDKVSNLFITYSPITSVDLPVSKVLGGLQLQETPQLTSAKLSQLTDVSFFITLLNVPSLTQLDLSKLQTVTDVYFSNSGLKDLNSMTVGLGGALTTTGSIAMMNNPALPVCAFNALVGALVSHKALNQAGNLECVCSDGGTGAVCQ